jgi:hypothetical protein
MSQVAGWVPAAAPAPLQVVHRTAVSTVIGASTPNAVSSSSSSSRRIASAPGRVRGRGPRACDVPKNASMMFWKSTNGLPAAPAPVLAIGSPPRSNISRLRGSERTS